MNPLEVFRYRPGEPRAISALKITTLAVISITMLATILVGAFAFEAITSPFMDWWWLVFVWFTPVMLVIVAIMAAWTAIRR